MTHAPLPPIEAIYDERGGNWLSSFTRVRHKKTGTVYRVIGPARIEATLEAAVIYVRADGEGPYWVRPIREFIDGRFEQVRDGAWR